MSSELILFYRFSDTQTKCNIVECNKSSNATLVLYCSTKLVVQYNTGGENNFKYR